MTNQIYLLMPFIMVKISKPTNTFYSNIVSAITIYPTIRCIQRIIIGDIKLSIPTCYAWPQPKVVFDNKWEYFFACNRHYVSYNQKFLPIFHQLSNILSEQRKRRIGYHDIRFFQQFDALWVTKISCLQNANDVLIILKEIANIG